MFAGYSDNIAKFVRCSQQFFCHGNFCSRFAAGMEQ